MGNSCRSMGKCCKSVNDYDTLEKGLAHYVAIEEDVNIAGVDIADRLLFYDERLGNAFWNDGNGLKQDLEDCEKMLKNAITEDDKAEEAHAYAKFGNVYRAHGDFKKAIWYHEKELEIAEKVDDPTIKAVEKMDAHGNLGTDYQCLGNFVEAKQQHLYELKHAEKANDKVRQGRANCNIGNDHFGLNEITRGIECHEKHLDFAILEKDKKGEGVANGNIGIGYCKLGRFEEAVEKHKIELRVAKEVGSKTEVANARLNLGSAYRGLHRTKLALYHDIKASFIASHSSNNVLEGNAFYSIGRDFERMGSTKQALKQYQKSVKLYNKVRDSLKNEDKWKISFRDSHQEVYTALWKTLLRAPRNTDKECKALCAAEQGRAQALVDLLHVRHNIKVPDHPEDTIRSYLSGKIAAQAVFLAIESNKLYFWVLCKASKEVCFRQLEVNMATIIQCSVQGISQAATGSEINYLCNLYKLVIEPIRDLLQDGDDLIIIPDGHLFLAPYNAFQHMILDENGQEVPKYLYQEFRIRIVPSLTSLKLISNSESKNLPSCALLVGDPGTDDDTRLENAEREVKQIKTVIEGNTQRHVIILTHAEATKTNVLQHISEVELIHIAAHAQVTTGEILLAGEGTDSGLTMSDVQGYKLQAKLVVLSCCNTGGGEVTADGVVGIARGFLAAGAHCVLVSLCEIGDQSTMQFMEKFYKELADRKERRSASLALQRTMDHFRNSKEFSAVKCWAPFVLIGNDVTLEFAEPEFHTL